jgi:hypothetical protein
VQHATGLGQAGSIGAPNGSALRASLALNKSWAMRFGAGFGGYAVPPGASSPHGRSSFGYSPVCSRSLLKPTTPLRLCSLPWTWTWTCFLPLPSERRVAAMGFGNTVDALLKTYSNCLDLLKGLKRHGSRRVADFESEDEQSLLRRSLRSDRARIQRAYSSGLSQSGGRFEKGDGRHLHLQSSSAQ